MADTSVAVASAKMSSQAQGGPGIPSGANGQGNSSHMPPPPLHIPQNMNPIPTAMTSPLSGGDHTGMMSPGGSGNFRRAAPEPNKRALYVGGLDQRVTEDVLRQIFETTGHVQNVKIIPDKNVGCLFNGTCFHQPTLTPFCRLKGTTTDLSNTTTLVLPSVPCRLSTDDEFTNR